MRYIDRAPRKGDRVRVEFEGVLTYGTDHITLDNGWEVELGNVTGEPSMTRVIAPEPVVGDVVTDDMDLPEGSVIGWRYSEVGPMQHVAVLVGEDWRFGSKILNVQAAGTPWRIVHIGGTP